MKGEIKSIGYTDDERPDEEFAILEIKFNRKTDKELFEYLMGKYMRCEPIEFELEKDKKEHTALFG